MTRRIKRFHFILRLFFTIRTHLFVGKVSISLWKEQEDETSGQTCEKQTNKQASSRAEHHTHRKRENATCITMHQNKS